MNQQTPILFTAGVAGDDPDDPGSCTDSEEGRPAPSGPGDPPAAASIAVLCPRDLAARLDLPWLDEHLRRAADLIGRPLRRLTARIVRDDEMATLHGRHLGTAVTTDVLTFTMSGPEEPIEADIALCADEAQRRASALGHTAERELLLYAVHALLHCAGFDDADEKASAAMHAEEDRILRAIGVGATFSREPSGHDEARDDDTNVTEARDD